VVLSESADFLYKTTDYYAPQHERSIAWNDPEHWHFLACAGARPATAALGQGQRRAAPRQPGR
jgi:hypothetical protein